MKKQEKQKISSSDAFQNQMYGAFDWAIKNKARVVAIIVPILALIAGIYIFNEVSQWQKQSRLSALGAIEVTYAKEEEAAQKKREAVQDEINKINEKEEEARKQKAAVEGQNAALSEAEKKGFEDQRQKLRADLKKIEPDHSASLAKYQEYFKENQGNSEGWAAGLRASSILVEDGKFAEAKEVLNSLLEHSRSSQLYQIHGGIVAIGVHEELGEYDQALKIADGILETASDELKPQILLAKGRVMLLKDSSDPNAGQIFDTIITKHGTSPEAQKAKAYKTLL